MGYMSFINESAHALDSELLRTFRAVAAEGSVTAGAKRVLRSQSAVSLQIRRLEEILGRRVFERRGRGIALTAYGETLLPVADRVVGLLDDAVADARAGGLTGTLRLGVPEEVGEPVLAGLVAGFVRAHPRIDLAVRCGLSAGFPEAVASGDLDAAVCDVEASETDWPVLATVPRAWVTASAHHPEKRDPLPVALFDRDCAWRDLAVQALERTGRPYRIVYTSESVAGIVAAVRSGLAVALMGNADMGRWGPGLERVEGLPAVPPSRLVLMRRPRLDPEIGTALEAALETAMQSALGRESRR